MLKKQSWSTVLEVKIMVVLEGQVSRRWHKGGLKCILFQIYTIFWLNLKVGYRGVFTLKNSTHLRLVTFYFVTFMLYINEISKNIMICIHIYINSFTISFLTTKMLWAPLCVRLWATQGGNSEWNHAHSPPTSSQVQPGPTHWAPAESMSRTFSL